MTVEQWQMDPTAKGLQKDSTAKELQKDPTEEGRQKGVKFFFRIIFCNSFLSGCSDLQYDAGFAGTVQTELYIQWAYFHNLTYTICVMYHYKVSMQPNKTY